MPAKLLQLCLTLLDPMDCSPPCSSVHGILQARILEWVVTSSPGDLPEPGIKPRSPALQADSLPAEPPGKPQIFLRNQAYGYEYYSLVSMKLYGTTYI